MDAKRKICIIGQGGVGKSSLLSLLQGKDIIEERNPTIGLEIESSKINGVNVNIWDLSGQERFKHMWRDFLRGSGLTILVCDSTEDNIEQSKRLLEKYNNYLGAKIIAIANKQDLPDSYSAAYVQKKLGGIKTYGMCALREELRGRFKHILEYELEFDSITTKKREN